jgi:hypothetical protein
VFEADVPADVPGYLALWPIPFGASLGRLINGGRAATEGGFHRRRNWRQKGVVMQVDANNQDDVQAGKTLTQAMGWLAAVGVAAAVGLAVVDVPRVDLSPQVLRTDGNAKRSPHAVTTPAETLATPTSGVDPALQRPEFGNDDHG